jgi:hypothetical protein
MSTTPAPSAGNTPPPLSYPDADDRAGHRLGAGVVTAIIVVVAVVLAALTLGVVLTKKKNSPPPAPPDPSSVVIGRPATASGVPAAATPMSPRAPAAAASPMSTSSNATIGLGPGISLTPADGWEVLDQTDNAVVVVLRKLLTRFEVTVGTGQSKDAKTQLAKDIAQLPDHSNLNNVAIEKCRSETLDSREFDQDDTCGFTADFVTNQGAEKVVGYVIELMNTASGIGALATVYAANSDEVNAAAPDAIAMLKSMVWPATNQ